MQNYEPDVTQLLGLYQQLEDDIVADMVRRMLKMGFVSESTAYQAEVLQSAGILYEDILQMIADRTDASVAQVRALFEDAGVKTVEIDNDTHEAAGEAPADIRQDGGMKQVLETGYRKTLGTMRNLVSTTANTTQTAFLQACDRAYMQVSSGAFSYQDAIRMAVRNLADGGAYVTYPTGHQDRIDVAVRRCVLTGVGQTAAAVAKKRAEDSGCQYMELTAHGGARPEHARWQGQLVVISGKRTRKVIDGLKVFTLEEIGYGDGRGFKGWNCRHNWHPYYPGLSTPNYTPEEIAKLDEKSISYNGEKYTEYEISQMQRKGERKVRALKRRAAALDEAAKNTDDPVLKQGLNDDFAAVSVRLKDAEKTLKDFCRQTGRRRDAFREQVNGFGRSTAQRAVQAKKRADGSLTSENNNAIIRPYEHKLPREKRKQIIKKASALKKPIFAEDRPDNAFASYVRNVPSKKGYYDVALHGSPTSVEFFGEPIDAYLLANIIRNRKDYEKGTKIRLLSCNTGNTESTGDCVAQIVANELGVVVEAPTDIIYVNPNGTFSIGNYDEGIMKQFYPRK
ncbi:phage minor capsid protein [uncultured Ruminococcus sp.]|uniref:phage minor capsid protein n=1 Tax=uncultured Ruminococcus sp. TaxID=165186 RepID=UPI0020653034|nr:phage minor capsid protein [uncultured Ruminococcus sp.]DAG57879.1 MAG TPA: minor capsid protein [Caudoviricetes sp.]